mgnify:CR=1 FL=1
MENGMTMGDCLRTNKLIILRGNSGSGKTTIAKELQQVFGNNTMLISQDVIRRDMLKVKERRKYKGAASSGRTSAIWKKNTARLLFWKEY